MKFCNFLKKKSKEEKSPKTKKKLNIFETFTKLWVSILLVVAVIDLQITYVLAFLGSEQIAETLSVAIVTEIIGVVCVYMVRAYFDSKTEGKQKLEEMKLDIEATGCTEDGSESENDDEDAVG